MKTVIMKQRIIYSAVVIALLVVSLPACKKVAGLRLQEDVDHTTSTIDPHINKTAWQYLKDRSVNDPTDTVFKRMYDAIVYSGIDSNEYLQTGRTFIFMHNDAVYRSGNPTDSYFGRYKIGSAAGTKWSDYSKQQVKNWLLYLIVNGEYSFDNVTPDNVEVKSLLPEGADAANPRSIMLFRVVNDRNSKFTINDFTNSVRSTATRTAGILSDNGPIHVIDKVVEYGTK
ncbi:hypothetical protein A3860_20845 [Niastella vici]|uniref:Uncharacterized protein n=1 Tax=Niastella vici TaxID=1703345 RepID=A0A1V9G198_9BACT|nr:fasciclin domain-containing protein [Niastella vici]OQP64419.1 hypothetical protein A3860_20845 [Niastella vici]